MKIDMTDKQKKHAIKKFEEIAGKVGGYRILSEKIGVTPAAITQAKKNNSIPVDWCHTLVQIGIKNCCKVKLSDFRPDIVKKWSGSN